ncbi:MAG TPA: TetR/AcrR family transcriptional regulator [Roseiflexaceae bacterium]|nr:TetR/AcrR family transcriptional regulator [Roseiflexaceae bacterium]
MSNPKPRGRPRTFHREAALETAMMLFWRHGYEGTSIADLTEALGVTPPTLYAVFGSKEQLYREVLAHYVSRGVDTERVMDPAVSAYQTIAHHMRVSAERFTDPSGPRGCMVSSASLYCGAENEAARTAATALRANTLALMVKKLEWAKHVGELPADADTLALARFYSSIIQGMSIQAVDGASAAELHRMVDLALAAWPGKQPEARAQIE